MAAYLVRRLLWALLILFMLSIFAFVMVRLIPGDPVVLLLGLEASEESLVAARESLGLDRPLVLAYGDWLAGIARGDLGVSIFQRKAVWQLLWAKIPVTFTLATAGLLLALLIGIPAGIAAALKYDSWFDTTVMFGSTLGLSMPSFWLGLVLIFTFSVRFRWFPSGGYVSLTEDFVEGVRRLCLPAFSIGIIQAALIARMTRSSMLEILWKDYIRTARAKGLQERIVLLKHALRNALIPIVTTVGMVYGVLLGGAIIIETVFTIPGTGRLLITAVCTRDYPIIQGVILLFGLTYAVMNLLVDVLYVSINPTITYS